ncbi:MAG: ORF6N domain-containing protein [Treponema sp.]|nr:ORF6N domain-containing protein [Treponema sp.]
MENEISILEENSIRSKIHVIRGQQVMLDFDLAQIYGYETKNFNRQVKNNIERFDSDFMFQLSDMEVEELSRCKNFIMNKGSGSNIKDPRGKPEDDRWVNGGFRGRNHLGEGGMSKTA